MRQNDGNSVLDIVFNKLIDRYNKPIFISANNGGPAVNTVYSTTEKAITVGGYIHRDTWYANYGIRSGMVNYVHNLSSRGPSEDGGFKPDIIALLDTLAPYGMFYEGFATGGAYQLPPGYMQASGTSFAAPVAAGAGAALISGAKQQQIKYSAESIKWALKSTARFIQNFGAHDQGASLINMDAAWEALKKGKPNVDVTSKASVNTILSNYLKETNTGAGIYEREGWVAGESKNRTIVFTRSTGVSYPEEYELRWIGNDGTFSSQQRIRLPLNVPVSLIINVTPKSSGVHSAILSIHERDDAYPVYQILNTVIASERFTEKNKYVVNNGGAVDYLGWKSYFFYVPDSASVFKVDMKVPSLLFNDHQVEYKTIQHYMNGYEKIVIHIEDNG